MATEIGKLIATFEADLAPFMQTRRKYDAEMKKTVSETARLERERHQIMAQNERAIEGLAKREADARIREGKRALSQIANSLNQQRQQMRDGISPLLAGAVGGLTAVAGISVVSEIRQAAGAVLEYSANLENTRIAFTTMMGSADAALKHLRDLQQFALKTPFEFPDLITASQRMQALGFRADQVVPILNDVGNAVAAAGGGAERLDRVVLAMSQMQSKGKVMTQELNQLAEAGIPAWKIMETQLGKTRAELVKMVEKGQISSDIFLRAFQRFSQINFGGLMEKQSHTFTGALSNIKDALLQTSATAFEPLFKKISEITSRIADEITKGKPTIAKALASLAGGLGEAAGLLGAELGKAIARGMNEHFRAAARLDFDSLAQTYMPIARGLGIGLGRAIREGVEQGWASVKSMMSLSGKGDEITWWQDPNTGRRIAWNETFRELGEFAVPGGAGQRSQGAGPTGIPRPALGLGTGTGGGGKGGGRARDAIADARRSLQNALQSVLETLRAEEDAVERSYDQRALKIGSFYRAMSRLEENRHKEILESLKAEIDLANKIKDPIERKQALEDLGLKKIQESNRHRQEEWRLQDKIKNIERDRLVTAERRMALETRARRVLEDIGGVTRPRRAEEDIGGLTRPRIATEREQALRQQYQEHFERMRGLAHDLTGLIDRAVYDGWRGGLIGALDIVKNIFLRQFEELLAGMLARLTSSGGGSGGGLWAKVAGFAIGAILGGVGGGFGKGGSIAGVAGKASGGPVSARTPYIVGERGPELFIPQVSGKISPNAGGNTIININVPVRSAGSYSSPKSRRQMAEDVAAALQGALG